MKSRFLKVRAHTEVLCKPLLSEDFAAHHLAHATWFWKEFVLSKYVSRYKVFNDDFSYIFKSHYNNAGKRVLGPSRGLMTRPSVEEVYGLCAGNTVAYASPIQIVKQNPKTHESSI